MAEARSEEYKAVEAARARIAEEEESKEMEYMLQEMISLLGEDAAYNIYDNCSKDEMAKRLHEYRN